jgi:DNA (cytosine-5)-methyltransferase 1
MRLMYECKPKYFLLENVMMGEKWEKILSKAIGVNPIMINSSLVSAQNRKRLYWTNIGLEPSGLFGYPQSTIDLPKDKGILLKDVLQSEVDEKYYIIVKNNNRLMQTLSNNKIENNCLIDSYNQTIHTEKSITISTRVSAAHCTHVYKESTTNAVEIRAIMLGRSKSWGAPEKSDGKSYTLCKEQCHGIKNKSNIRRLTPIECERLQTVKDNYTNHVSDSQRYKMLGNGWTVDVICHLFSYMKTKKILIQINAPGFLTYYNRM